MRAVVVKSDWGGDGSRPSPHYPSPLLYLVDRPIIQHLCEGLVGRNVTTVDWVHHGPSDEVRRFLGRGERWGLYFRHHIANTLPECYGVSRAVLAGGSNGDPVLFGHADRVVPRNPVAHADPAPVLLYGSKAGAPESDWDWDGWAVLSGRACRQFPTSAADEAALARLLAGHALGECRWEEVPRSYGARTLGDYLVANRKALSEAAPGLWVPPSARVHPTATLVGPVHIGRNVEVGAGAVVGPHVTLGAGCVVGRRTVVADAVILPDTYVACGARLVGVLADRDRLYRAGPDGRASAQSGGPVACLKRHPLSGLTPALKTQARRAGSALARLAGPRRPAASVAVAEPAVVGT